MSKKFLLIFLVWPLLGAGCASSPIRTEPPASSSLPAPSPVGPVGTPTSGPSDFLTVEYKDRVFIPKELRIKTGETVTFINGGGSNVWPASDIHPTHLLCPGFDARRSLKPGESWSFTFREKKTCSFHNHLSAAEVGKIIVE